MHEVDEIEFKIKSEEEHQRAHEEYRAAIVKINGGVDIDEHTKKWKVSEKVAVSPASGNGIGNPFMSPYPEDDDDEDMPIQSRQCEHSWQEYVGLHEVDYTCTLCGERRNKI